jgi:predicted DNA-binding protein YlxM (UPF0122 family)
MEENRYMAKMRVHELAKELNIKSQEVIDTLNGTQFAVKNVQSGLEDEAQQIVRKKYAKTMRLRQPTDQRKRQASQQFSMPSTVSRVGKQMVETAAEIMEITVRSAGMAMEDAIISHHVLSSTALLSQDLSERELCAL